MIPNFVIVRFAPGAAGRFLITMLMGSDDVAHYDSNCKTIKEKLNYLKTSFTKDLDRWLLTEPSDKLAWGITFVSNKYPRGNNLSISEFEALSKEHCTPWYFENVALGKKIIIPWNKSAIPVFYKGASISIIIDKPSKRWFHRAHWIKHYGLINGKIHLKENDPAVHRAPLDKIVRQFNNPIYSNEKFISFVKKNVVGTDINKLFYDINNLEHANNDISINLSSLLNESQCLNVINNLCIQLRLKLIDQTYLKEGFNHWRNLHSF
jgi:hypothetical protein